jgi:tape measure domain-containing protein
MATVSNTITMKDKMTPVLRTIIKALQSTVDAMAGVDHVSNASFRRAQRDVQAASEALDDFNRGAEEIVPTAQRGANAFAKLRNPLVTAASAIYTIKSALQGLSSVTNVSDEFILTNARLDLMNDGLVDTAQLQDKILASAQRSRAEYGATASSIAKMGILAKDAFNSTEEIVAFTELMNKSFKVGGAGIQEQTSAMYQLTQAMAAGKLQGDEFSSIMENAPMVASAIAEFTGKSKGELKEMSSEGLITADIIKGALFAAADDINGKFATMPKTFGDTWTSVKNQTLEAFQPVMERMNEFVNSDGFQTFSNNAMRGITWVANKTVDLMNLVTDAVGWVKDNESTVKNVLYGIGAVLGTVVIAKTIAAGAAAIDMAKKFQEAGMIFGVSFKTFGIIAVIALIATLILWIIDLYNTNEQFRDKVQQVWADYGDAIIATIVAIGAIFAAIYFPTISAAIANTLTLMWTTIQAGATMVLTWIQVGLAFLAAHWWILLIVAAVALAIYAWNNMGEAGKILAIIIGAIIAVIVIWIAVQKILNLVLTANPIGVIIMAIAALIAIVIAIVLWIMKLWETNMDFKYGVIKIWNSILNFFDQVPIFFQWVGNGIADAFGWAKIQVLDILQSMANGAISIINDLIGLLNKIPGVAIDPIQELTFATTAAAEEEAAKQARADSLQASKDKAAANAAERAAKMATDRAKDEAALAKKRAEAEAEKQANEAKKNENDQSKYLDNQSKDTDYSKYAGAGGAAGAGGKSAGAAGNPTIAGGNLDSVGKIKDDVSITDEDIKLLKDVAATEFVNKYTTLRPEMSVQFGDVKETADVNKILGVIEDMVEEAYASSLVGEGA